MGNLHIGLQVTRLEPPTTNDWGFLSPRMVITWNRNDIACFPGLTIPIVTNSTMLGFGR